jgi:hypothetical protein
LQAPQLHADPETPGGRPGDDVQPAEGAMKKIAALAMIAAAAALAPRAAHAQQTVVTCESINGQRQMCGVGNASSVTLRHQLSGSACVQGQSWGVARNAVWVSRGCRAEFNVTQYSTGYGSGRYGNNPYGNNTYDNRYNNRYNRYGNNETASAAALCRRAVRSQIGNVNVNAWQTNGSANNPRFAWRASNGQSGTCRVDRNGNVSLRYSR